MGAALWIGPAIIAAVISSLVTVASWFVSHQRERKLETIRRDEKIRDLQTACLAEILGNRAQFEAIDLDLHATEVRTRIANEAQFVPFVPRDASTVVFDAILPEIHVLPSSTILPVVAYYKQVMRIAHIVDDLKSESYSLLGADRRFEIYLDYLGMIRQSLRQATDAEAALQLSLKSPMRASSPDGDPAAPRQSAEAKVGEKNSSNSPSQDT